MRTAVKQPRSFFSEGKIVFKKSGDEDAGASARRSAKRSAYLKIARDVYVVCVWALYVIARLFTTTMSVVFVAVYGIPWAMVVLAGALGVTPDTPILDLVFVYGASGLFVAGAALAGTLAAIRTVNRGLRWLRDLRPDWIFEDASEG